MTINFVPTIISAVILVSHSPYAPASSNKRLTRACLH